MLRNLDFGHVDLLDEIVFKLHCFQQFLLLVRKSVVLVGTGALQVENVSSIFYRFSVIFLPERIQHQPWYPRAQVIVWNWNILICRSVEAELCQGWGVWSVERVLRDSLQSVGSSVQSIGRWRRKRLAESSVRSRRAWAGPAGHSRAPLTPVQSNFLLQNYLQVYRDRPTTVLHPSQALSTILKIFLSSESSFIKPEKPFIISQNFIIWNICKSDYKVNGSGTMVSLKNWLMKK